VTGIDISEKMINIAKERAKEENLRSAVTFSVADAQKLPFEGNTFNIIISEGTTVLMDVEKALKEYLRVTKLGGYVGLNELSWRKKPSKELVEKTFAELGVKTLEYAEWMGLLTNVGLEEVDSATYEYRNFSWENIKDIGFFTLVKIGLRCLVDPKMRKWIKRQEKLFGEYSEYWGYGLYVGRKLGHPNGQIAV
jgi:ubiquinone/menaquinone biosynthesis C-methylase UbiE